MRTSRFPFYQLGIPDWCFGLFKRHYRLCKIGCLEDIVHAQLVGTQDGSTVVPMYDWSSFFDNYTIKTALKGIIKMHHFHFSRDYPGGVKVNLLKGPWNPTQDDLPEQRAVDDKYGTRCALSQHSHYKHYLSIQNYSLYIGMQVIKQQCALNRNIVTLPVFSVPFRTKG